MQFNQIRQSCINFLTDHIKLEEETSVEIERGIYNWALKYSDEMKIIKNWQNKTFVNCYQNKVRSILTNLDGDSYLNNDRLIKRLREKEFQPYELAFLRPETMFPEVWRDCIDRKIKKEETVYEERPVAMTNQFLCSKCRKRECVFQEIQLRSCDEPMTLFITCINCGHRWKM